MSDERRCPACGSPQWVSVSLDKGWTRRPQCVPCGAYHKEILGSGWKNPDPISRDGSPA